MPVYTTAGNNTTNEKQQLSSRNVVVDIAYTITFNINELQYGQGNAPKLRLFWRYTY